MSKAREGRVYTSYDDRVRSIVNHKRVAYNNNKQQTASANVARHHEDGDRLCEHEAKMAAQKLKREAKEQKSKDYLASLNAEYGDETPAAADVAAPETTDAGQSSDETQLDAWLERQVQLHVLSEALVDRLTDAIAQRRLTVKFCLDDCMARSLACERAPSHSKQSKHATQYVRAGVEALAKRGLFQRVGQQRF